jgi:hypothetical protein
MPVIKKLLLKFIVLVFFPAACLAQYADESDSLWSIVVPTAAARDIDMGQVPIRSGRDSLVTAFLENTGPADIRIDAIDFAGANPELFSVFSGQPPFVIPEGDAYAVGFRYRPEDAGPHSAVILVRTQVDTLRRTIVGEGIRVAGRATLAVDTIRAHAGEIIEIPVYLRDAGQLEQSGAQHLYAELRFNRTLLAPLSGADVVDGRDRVLSLDGLPLVPDGEGVIARPRFMAMLGDAEGCPLIIENSHAVGGEVDILEIPGYFQLLSVCHEGGTRLYDDAGRIALHQNRPNPFNAHTVIAYDIVEEGHTRLAVLDLLGRTVRVLADGPAAAGSHAVVFDASALATGTYLYVLQTPTVTQVRRMEVVK